MAEQRILYPTESKGPGTSCEDDSDLSVITVIEKKSHSIAREKYVSKGPKNVAEESTASSVRTEVILLDEAPAANINRSIVKTCENRRVIELSDTISKMELRRQFKVDVASQENSGGRRNDSRRKPGAAHHDDDDTSAELISRLPPGTILIKQNTNSDPTTTTCGPEDSDYVHDSSKDSTETNSSESSGAASYNANGKVKRMQHRSVRTKKIVEVRRNPVRNKKKKPLDEDFLRPRQRLLSVKRKAGFVVEPVARKRVKAAPVPYMNTRSVTRKMYTVGATYQAPTIHDAIEWKEWPAHGMHERPVWHPQFGLAYGYNDRHFLSLDDRTYREIIDESVIEVVSVDPHPERVLFASGKRKLEKLRSRDSSDDLAPKISTRNENSFESCMHGSLHSVLAYCAQVVTPTYKNNVDTKLKRISQLGETSYNIKPALKLSPDFCKQENKIDQRPLPTEASTSIKISGPSKPSNSAASEVPKCLVVPRRTISFTNVRNIQGNILQEVFGRASKNTLIFLKPTDPPVKTEKMSTTAKSSSVQSNATNAKSYLESVAEEMNIARLEDSAISDEALMEMSSMYNKMLPNEELDNVGKNVSEVPLTAIVAAKTVKKSQCNDAKEEMPANGLRANYSGARSQNLPASKNADQRFSNSNQAAEIAKILAEYNQKAAKNTGVKSACLPSVSALNARATSTKAGKSEKDCGKSQSNRTTFLSVVEQPKKLIKDEDAGKNMYRGCNAFSKPEINVNHPNADKPNILVKTEEPGNNVEDHSRAMDLSTGKWRESETEKKPEVEEPVNRQWLQELIEDTALLYCAAAGVRQDDVVNYLDSLDSAQSIEWLGS